MQQNGFPLADLRFDVEEPEAGSAHLLIAGLSVSSVFAPALRGKTIAHPMLGLSVPRSQRAVDLVCDAIANDIGRPLTIPEMERLTGVTGRTLNYAFQERFGCSPQEWQRNFLLDHARRLLSDGERARSVKEVAYELGFSSPASFSNFYRRRFGELPSSTLFDRPGRR